MQNRFQIRSFFAQFPFLSKIQDDTWWGLPNDWCAEHGCTETNYHTHPTFVSESKVDEVQVSRISPDFLNKRPWSDGATGAVVNIDESERILLLDANGDVLTEVEQSFNAIHNEAHWDNECEQKETVGEALLRLQDPDAVAYAVSIHTGYVIRNHESVGGYKVTLYKSPKGFSLREWVAEQLFRATAEVEAIVAEIDAEPYQTA